MIRKLLSHMWSRITGLGKDCQGFVVVSTLAIFLFLFILCAFVYAVGETIHQRIKMQNACDAAAYSAAVVQADGLSRMATINRAMAWSYVQMTNRQMDYITYRWLKLTVKRFQEDLTNAGAFNSQAIFAVDKELGWWALLEVAATCLVSEILGHECSGLKDKSSKPTAVGHNREGHGYWCGLEVGDRLKHNIRLNVNKESKDNLWDQAANAAMDTAAQMVFSKDNIEKILSIFSFIDSKDTSSPEGWGGRFGNLIDHDKANIRRMNNALARINTQMNFSMKMTAENILKSMLKDRRKDPASVLQDYYISIHIPEGKNPYETDSKQRSASAKSFFSPLRNTETDEMLFLNMISPENAGKSLQDHFPTLIIGTPLPFGLDQWFIRGKANYSDGKDHCYDEAPLKDVSFSTVGKHSVTTQRDEGALGIQRVYKDSNLNETNAGFFSRKKETVTKTGTHQYRTNLTRSEHRALPDCCKGNANKYKSGSGNRARFEVYTHTYTYQEEVYTEDGQIVWRGNHLIDLLNVFKVMTDGLKGFMGSGSEADVADDGDDEGIQSIEDLEAEKKNYETEKEKYQQQKNEAANKKSALEAERTNASPERRQEIDEEINSLNQTIETCDQALASINEALEELNKIDTSAAPGTDDRHFSESEQSQMGEFASMLMDGIAGVLGSLTGEYIDIQPSCGNDPNQRYTTAPACSKITNPTTSLYSEYRWASCKWFCLTKGFTWVICTAFGKPIYCDQTKAEIARLGGGMFSLPIKGRGIGHFGWPKWFCGSGPTHTLLSFLPPLYGPITGKKHGYMDSVWNFGSDGFLKPIKALWGNEEDRVFSRKEYESCAMFPDGLDLNPYKGHNAWPGLIRGHARIYADDKEIFDNRYVGAKCKPWVLNERFFAGDGTILVGAAMKHTNPFVQLFNLWNTRKEEKDGQESYVTGSEPQENADKTVLAAFNIPKGNFMWTMSAARAGVRRLRRNGAYDQERQYQITYDSIADAENLEYSKGPYVLSQKSDTPDDDSITWVDATTWGKEHDENPMALSRSVRPDGNMLPPALSGNSRYFIAAQSLDSVSASQSVTSVKQSNVPIYNGCPCGNNYLKFKNLWNLCETDWDATLLPVRYAWQKAILLLAKGSGSRDLEKIVMNSKDSTERKSLIKLSDEYSRDNDGVDDSGEIKDLIFGNGKHWCWNSFVENAVFYMAANPFVLAGWKQANATFFADVVNELLPEIGTSAIAVGQGLKLNSKVPEGKQEKTVDVVSIIKDKVL